MPIPADEQNYYNSLVTGQIAEINLKSQNSSSITPRFSDYFQTPDGVPSDTNYFNDYTNNSFGTNSLLNPFNNYINTVKTSITNCQFPPLPSFSNLLSNNTSNLLNVNIFDQALKSLSIKQKTGSLPITNIGSILKNNVSSFIKSITGPISGYLKNISNCISKLAG